MNNMQKINNLSPAQKEVLFAGIDNPLDKHSLEGLSATSTDCLFFDPIVSKKPGGKKIRTSILDALASADLITFRRLYSVGSSLDSNFRWDCYQIKNDVVEAAKKWRKANAC